MKGNVVDSLFLGYFWKQSSVNQEAAPNGAKGFGYSPYPNQGYKLINNSENHQSLPSNVRKYYNFQLYKSNFRPNNHHWKIKLKTCNDIGPNPSKSNPLSSPLQPLFLDLRYPREYQRHQSIRDLRVHR